MNIHDDEDEEMEKNIYDLEDEDQFREKREKTMDNDD